MPATTQLLSIASGPLGSALAPGSGAILTAAGDRGLELLELLRSRNGFHAFFSALHVFPVGKSEGVADLEAWNAPALWRETYGDLAEGCLFFAEDIFGGQFCLRDGSVDSFDPETGSREFLAATIEEWAQHLLVDHDVLCGTPLAREWQERYGAIPEGKRLVPKIPFVSGGEFETANLHLADPVEAMRFRGLLASRIRDLPAGAKLTLKITH